MTKIEWTQETWNPVRGCSKVSPGCKNCYAERTAARGVHGAYKGLVITGEGAPRWTGDVRLVPDVLDVPLRRRKPTTWFVNSMSDLFHERLTNEQIAAVFGAMAAAPWHTFQVLTKRSARMREWFSWAHAFADRQRGIGAAPCVASAMIDACYTLGGETPGRKARLDYAHSVHRQNNVWPLPNVHIGVSVEDQPRANERIPDLLETPAAVRFLSGEPLLGPVHLGRIVPGPSKETLPAIDWVIVGGESGPGARPCDIAWIRSVVQQCKGADVPVFVKQLGSHSIDADSYQWVRTTKAVVNPGDWHLLGPQGEHAATVFCANIIDDGVDRPGPRSWHTWDADGIGGENAIDPDLETAKSEALLSTLRWAQFPKRHRNRKGNDMDEWPADLRVREMPR